jgi:hypothetical protein
MNARSRFGTFGVSTGSWAPFPPVQGGVGTPAQPTAASRDELMIVVAGVPGAWIGLLPSAGGWENGFVIKKIDLPRNWDTLVAKYKNNVCRNSLFNILNFKYFYLALTGCFQGCIWITSSFMLFEKTMVLQYRHCHINSFAGGP